MLKKLLFIFQSSYYPYLFYYFDLLTERHLKHRTGECIECCRYLDGTPCGFANTKTKRCKIYNKRQCNIWFPISQKEIEWRKKQQPNFTCNFKFKT